MKEGLRVKITIIILNTIYALFITILSIYSLMRPKIRYNSVFGIIGALLLLIASLYLQTNRTVALLSEFLGLISIQIQAYRNGKALYAKVHISHHVVRAILHLLIFSIFVASYLWK